MPSKSQKRQPPDFSQGLPAAEESEKLVLALVMIGACEFSAVAGTLQASDFQTERNQRIFRSMQRLQEHSLPIDRVTVIEELKKQRWLSSVGGISYLLSLEEGMPQLTHVEHYAALVLDASLKRQMIHTADAVAKRVMNADEGTDELIQSSISAFQQIASRNGHNPEPVPTVPQWPDPIHEDGFYGVAGDVVRLIEPHTESDPAALLVQFLIGWGNLAGRGPYYQTENDRHHTNEYAVICGTTSKGRKGTSWGRIRGLLETVDEHWNANCMLYGLGSGEALIESLGKEDKRRLVMESEFARLLAIIERDGMTISSTFRQCWDSGEAHITTRSAKEVHITGGHLSMIGHVTREEVLKRMSSTEIANGFGNRIVWVCARRSKSLPMGGGNINFGDIPERLKAATDHARRAGNTLIRFDSEAEELWKSVYDALSAGKPGLFGSLVSRAEPHCLRLALTEALLNCTTTIKVEHLKAALAIWRFSEASTRFIWGEGALGDENADQILKALRDAGAAGLTRTGIRDLFSRNQSAEEIDRALRVLAEKGLARSATETTGGRPTTRWMVL
jgi:hypothetical protein